VGLKTKRMLLKSTDFSNTCLLADHNNLNIDVSTNR